MGWSKEAQQFPFWDISTALATFLLT